MELVTENVISFQEFGSACQVPMTLLESQAPYIKEAIYERVMCHAEQTRQKEFPNWHGVFELKSVVTDRISRVYTIGWYAKVPIYALHDYPEEEALWTL